MLKLSLKGVNTHVRTRVHTHERRELTLYLSSLNTLSRWSQKVCITALIYINEVLQMQPDVFTFAKREREETD